MTVVESKNRHVIICLWDVFSTFYKLSFKVWSVSHFCNGTCCLSMMMSSNGNIFHVTGPLWGESTGHRWIPLTKASDVECWSFLWSAPEQTVGQTIEMLVIDAIMLIMMSLSYSQVFAAYLKIGCAQLNLWVPDFQMNCDMTYQESSPSNGHQGGMPYWCAAGWNTCYQAKHWKFSALVRWKGK